MKLTATFFFVSFFTLNYCQGQDLDLKFKEQKIIIEKGKDEVIVPIEIDIETKLKTKKDEFKGILQLNISRNTDTGVKIPFEYDKLSIRDEKLNILLNKRKTVKVFYAVFKDLNLSKGNSVLFTASLIVNGVTKSTEKKLVIMLIKAQDLIYSLDDYLYNDTLKLDNITKLESTNNIVSVYGYHQNNRNIILKRQISLKGGQAFVFGEKNASPYSPRFTLFSVPFKFRPKKEDLKATTSSGLSNLGVNMDFLGWKREYYSSSGRKSSHRFGIGLMGAPAVEELDSLTTKGYLKGGVKSKQLFISTGISISYSYNNLTFVFVPVGLDFATSTVGKEWVYKKSRWLGFGIGVDVKLFSIL
jgi:hypothetical protein